MKKGTKKITTKSPQTTNYSDKEMKRYLGALNEQNNENMKVIKEGFQIINHRLDNHDKKFDSIDKKQDLHTEMIGTLMQDVSVLKDDVSTLKDDMQIVKKELKKKVDYDEFLSLVQRVNKLEAKN